jgi:23S rRNA (guanosine2251-2'-O)-methyltransferase
MTAGPRRKGTGGHGKRRLAGKGPTPPAHMRPGHPARRRAAADKRAPDPWAPDQRAAGTDRDAGSGRPQGTRRDGASPGGAGTGRGSRYGSGSGKPVATRGAPRGPRALGGPGRAADGPEVVAGRNAVLESLRAAVPANALYVAHRMESDDRVNEAIRLAADAGVAVLEAGRAELDRLTDGALHQGVALRVPAYEYAHPGDLTARAEGTGAPALIVALDGVTDPRNLGAVARSAAAFGAHGVVIPARRSAGVTASAWKVSAGALAHLTVARAPNLVRVLAGYQQAGLVVAGLDARGGTDVGDLEVADGPLVLVVGSEGRGLSRLAAERCDLLVRIPVAARAESLNAGVAAGIALYEVARRRAGR